MNSREWDGASKAAKQCRFPWDNQAMVVSIINLVIFSGGIMNFLMELGFPGSKNLPLKCKYLILSPLISSFDTKTREEKGK